MPQRDDGYGDIADAALRKQLAILAWFFGVRRICEKDDVAGDDVRFQHLMDGGVKSCENENTTAHGRDASNGAFCIRHGVDR